MDTSLREYSFDSFPPFFDGLLPEGIQLESLLRRRKIDRGDLFAQLVAVGADLVGVVTVESMD
jgi:serine/threonine-protein kinase HipA